MSSCIFRSCAEPKAKNILDDLSTLVEYYSVSNDSMDRRMMVSEAVPGNDNHVVIVIVIDILLFD